ncbi:MAG TPA: PDZ domain-containing protein [Terriglobales bacterium]|nr:PDZ domain-containing protein [Terriglobales bacterium]
MRNWILRTLLIAPLLGSLCAAKGAAFNEAEPFGWSSEESLGGGSYLGVDTRDVTADRLGTLKLKEEKGVEVTMVDQDAPAGKAGLKERDVILTLNGTAVESVEQLRRLIREVPPGRVITLGLSRAGQPVTVKVQLADRKKAFAYSNRDDGDFKFAMPTLPVIPALPDLDVPVSIVVVHSSRRSGLMVENLTPQLGDFLGARNGQGVLVRSVEKGSRAEKAGFRAGDVIVKVNNEPIADTGDFTHSFRSGKNGTISVGVIRDKKEQTLTLTLPERNQSELFQESFEMPEIDAEAQIDMDTVKEQMQRVRPQLEFAERKMKQIKPEIDRATREFCEQQGQLKKDMQHMQRDLLREHRHLQEKLRNELRGEWTQL